MFNIPDLITVLNQPELTQQTWDTLLRKPEQFHWYIAPILVFVFYIYFNEISKKNWKGVAAGLSFYMIHWFFEIMNSLIQHFFGHALWLVPTGTSFLLLMGVCIEISLAFSVTGLVFSKILPEDPKVKILGIPNRLFFAAINAALISVIEIFLAWTPAFHWVYPWWGALPVFITVYIPFFYGSFLCHDWSPKAQKIFIGGLFCLNAVMLAVFAGVLGWI